MNDELIDDEDNMDDSLWLMAEGEEEGHPLLFRARASIPTGVLKMQYPLLISVYWPYEETLNEGMPDTELNETQIDFEMALEPLDNSEDSHLMLVITGAGKKEWHYYAQSEEAWLEKFNDLLEEHPEYPLNIEICDDPEWSLYGDFITGLEESGLQEE